MQPLLKIQNVPISIEYKVKRAALEYQSTPAKVNVSRDRGAMNIQTTLPKVNIDTYETRASAGLKSPTRSVQEFAQAGVSAGYEATRNYAEEGNQLLDSRNPKGAIADLVASRIPLTVDTRMAFIPSTPPQISAEPGTISFDYTMDKLTFDWNINHKPQLEYVPGSIEFSVAQYPEVIIEYVGSPIYVPPSSDPNYVPPSVDTTA